MPIITLYNHGSTAGTPPMKNNHKRAKRGKVGGWSQGATRRNTKFLYSVEDKKLTGSGYAVTLTLRDCPEDAKAWHRLRRAFEHRMRRMGMLRLHWVTEWQRRGVPHLHGALWLPDSVVERYRQGAGLHWLENAIITAWMQAGAWDYGGGVKGQDVKPITGAVGWLKYLSKHAARGVSHYQRNPENIPEAWQSETGRVWGHCGHWPVAEGLRFQLQNSRGFGDGGFFAYRRLVRSWRVADARSAGDARRLVSARRMLQVKAKDLEVGTVRSLSQVRGVSEWVGVDLALAMLANLADRGFEVRQVWKDDPPDRGDSDAVKGEERSVP